MFPRKQFSTKYFFHNIQKNQENIDEDGASTPRLLILFVGSIGRKDPLDISADYLSKNTGV